MRSGQILLQVCLSLLLCSRTLRTRPLDGTQAEELEARAGPVSWKDWREEQGAPQSSPQEEDEEVVVAEEEVEAEESMEEEEARLARLLGTMKQEFLRKLNLSSPPQEQSRVRPPEFMVQLYNKYASDTSSTPRADVIRSFSVQDITLSESQGSVSRHRLLFNISIPSNEEISSAQLRLFTLTQSRVDTCLEPPGTAAATIRVYQLENHTEHRLGNDRRKNSREQDHRTGKVQTDKQTEEKKDRQEKEKEQREEVRLSQDAETRDGELLKEDEPGQQAEVRAEREHNKQEVETDQIELKSQDDANLLPPAGNHLRMRRELRDGRQQRSKRFQTHQSAYSFLDEKEVAWSKGSWEMFDVTAALHAPGRSGLGATEFEVRVQRAPCGPLKGGAEGVREEGGTDISLSLKGNTSAILIVFSNDQRSQRQEAQQDLQQMLSHEDEAVFSGAEEPRDTSEELNSMKLPMNTHPDLFSPQNSLPDHLQSLLNSLADDVPAPQDSNPNFKGEVTGFVTPFSAPLRNSLPDDVSSPQDSNGGFLTPLTAPLPRRKRQASDYCRRTSLRVNFKDIGWHEWIVAPPEYEAYECKGTCVFPLSSDVTPSKHAIIQALVNLSNPKKANKACCVPTKLDPITVMYQENGIITVRHFYEEMRVAACGCR